MKVFAVFKETYEDCENITHTLVGLHSKEENAQRHAKIITFEDCTDYRGREISGWIQPIELDSVNLDELEHKVKTRFDGSIGEDRPSWYEPEHIEGYD